MQHYTYAHIRKDTGKIFYIGLGSVSHRYKTKTKRNIYWNNIVEKAGGFEAIKLAFWNTREEAAAHEILLIASFKDMGYKLANLSLGGESGAFGVKRSNETKLKLSEAQKKRPKIFGKKHTEETKQKIRLAHLGKKKNPEAVAKSNAAQKGKKRDPILVEKTASAHRGMKRSEETKAKMRAAWVARKTKK